MHSWLLHFSINMKIFSQILLFLLLINPAFSQGITAIVNKKTVSLNDYFQLTFTIKNADAKSFSPPKFTNFKVLAGPSTSSSSNIQFINGKMSRSTSYSYTYTLQPTKVGKFTIGSASCMIKGKKITSNSVQMQVVKDKFSHCRHKIYILFFSSIFGCDPACTLWHQSLLGFLFSGGHNYAPFSPRGS